MRTAIEQAGSRRRLAQSVGVVFASVLGLAAILPATDPPHWAGAVATTDCTSACHTLHQASGGQLTAAAQNAALCQSCHTTGSLPVTDAMKARPGIGGTSHAFGVPAVNALYGAQVPATAQMSLRVMNGAVVCSTCHNQHSASSAMGGTPRIGAASRVAGSGTGALTTGGSYSGATGLWYLVEVVAAGSSSSARYRYSKDNGTSWFPLSCTSAALATCRTASTLPAALESGILLGFTGGVGSFALGDRFEFFAAWPFLRARLDRGDNASGEKFCRDCHASWQMTHTDVETWDGGLKSHPVGVALNANGSGYDRAMPLDGNGGVQGVAGDGNATNDLRFDEAGNVQCLSCHGAHYADSNTGTVDTP